MTDIWYVYNSVIELSCSCLATKLNTKPVFTQIFSDEKLPMYSVSKCLQCHLLAKQKYFNHSILKIELKTISEYMMWIHTSVKMACWHHTMRLILLKSWLDLTVFLVCFGTILKWENHFSKQLVCHSQQSRICHTFKQIALFRYMCAIE